MELLEQLIYSTDRKYAIPDLQERLAYLIGLREPKNDFFIDIYFQLEGDELTIGREFDPEKPYHDEMLKNISDPKKADIPIFLEILENFPYTRESFQKHYYFNVFRAKTMLDYSSLIDLGFNPFFVYLFGIWLRLLPSQRRRELGFLDDFKYHLELLERPEDVMMELAKRSATVYFVKDQLTIIQDNEIKWHISATFAQLDVIMWDNKPNTYKLSISLRDKLSNLQNEDDYYNILKALFQLGYRGISLYPLDMIFNSSPSDVEILRNKLDRLLRKIQ